MKTLNDILKEHPEWGNLPVGIYRDDGEYDFIDGSGMVYMLDGEDVEDGLVDEPILVFAGN